jgi:hypothetical protein
VRGTAVLILLAACSPSRDVVPETRDVHVVKGDDAGAPPTNDAYRYVARRAHGAIGLSGITGDIAQDDAQRWVDHLANEMEACAERLEKEGSLVSGATRMVVAQGPNGNGLPGDTELQAGPGVAANALLCLVAPVRAAPFPGRAGPGGAVPAMLVEATWQPVRRGNVPVSPDAGPP